MKRRHAVLLGVVAVAGVELGLVGCERALPTEPDRGLVEIRPKAEEASLDLAGRWYGTITFHAVDGDVAALSCDGSVSFTVVLSQDGAFLTGGFRTSCPGELQIRGVVNGGFLSGSLNASNGISLGSISGSVTSSRIAFRTLTRLGQDQGYKGQPPAVSSEVALNREDPSARQRPVLAGGVHSSRVFETQR